MSPPKIEDGASAPTEDFVPDTKSLAPEGRAGNLSGGSSAIIREPEIAVVVERVPPGPTLPDIVPMSAKRAPFTLKYH